MTLAPLRLTPRAHLPMHRPAKRRSALLAAVACFACIQAVAAPPASSPAAQRAQSLVLNNPASAARHPEDTFSVLDVMVDADGTEHVRMARRYRGLPVFAGDIVVHARSGKLKSVSKTLATAARPDLAARISQGQAIEEAGVAFGSNITQVLLARQVIYAHRTAPTLAWEVRLLGKHDSGVPLDMTYFVNATTGHLLLGVSNVHHATLARAGGGKGKPPSETTPTTPGIASIGTGASLLNGAVLLDTVTTHQGYTLTDTLRGGSVVLDGNHADLAQVASSASAFADGDNAWGDGTLRNRATVATDAHFGAASAWDYFAQVFGRSGIWGDGRGSTGYVHVGSSMSNAYWYNGAMYFGDGNRSFRLPYVSLDIVAHEMSHGITQATAGLIYSGESGGLNEATSDIFGAMVERFANNPSDPPDYLFGEKIVKSGAIRYMFKPSLNGSAVDCYTPDIASLGPHASSGVGNRFFYLLTEGAVVPSGTGLSPSDLVCNGNTGLRGIGPDASQRIWYHALTRYMVSGTHYAAARQATLQAAQDLYGAGSNQQATVAAAWSAVGVN